jgi:F0F1-type ATP synthase membrane subunit c/vacuolar-type H+-ATPase subunit K
MYLVTAAQKLGAGLSKTGLAGCGLVIGIVFTGLLLYTAINTFIKDDLFRTAILGFVLTEAIALFTLMITLIIILVPIR